MDRDEVRDQGPLLEGVHNDPTTLNRTLQHDVQKAVEQVLALPMAEETIKQESSQQEDREKKGKIE